MKIESIKVKRLLDEHPDTSCIGEYTDDPNDWSICRCCGEYLTNCDDEHEIPRKCRNYRFFLPYAGGEKQGTADYQKYGKQDYDRMESLNGGNWCFIGVQAEAEVSYPVAGGSNGHRRLETFTSGGLWGIESDSDDDYLAETENEQLTDLVQHLSHFNIKLDLSKIDIERIDL